MWRGCVFFFKQKTAYEMRISDWSSDVCSSDLQTIAFTDVEVNALEQPAAALNKAKVFIGENRCRHRAGVRRDDRKGQAQAWQACCADTPIRVFLSACFLDHSPPVPSFWPMPFSQDRTSVRMGKRGEVR